jgi:uncharacterized protein YdaU (DUF1376 family)
MSTVRRSKSNQGTMRPKVGKTPEETSPNQLTGVLAGNKSNGVTAMANRFPFFPFYGDDFYNDPLVQRMNLEQEAVYMRLLWAAWKQDQKGTLPCDDCLLCKIAGIKKTTLARNKEVVLKPFYFGEDGRWHQKRSEKEANKAQNRSEQAKNSAESRWRNHKKNGKSDADALLAQHCDGNAIASGSGSNSLAFSSDPNEYVPPEKPRVITHIDRAKPPFPETNYWKKETAREAVCGYLEHVDQKFGRRFTPLEFRCLIADFERECKNADAIDKIVRLTIRNGRNHIRFPSETGQQI